MLIVVFNAGTINFGAINAGTFLFSKIIGLISAVILHYFSAKENYFYFRNAGYAMWRIFVNAFVIDLSICILLITLSQLILHAATYFKG
ncbi:MAG: hypothetical protein AAGC65_17725 [Mucilaginibacter sp.]|uniref:hypothetical protein n=1 Tax=Mucilaginibacter sp. TaxID=1882438 RepID=UPI0031A9D18D